VCDACLFLFCRKAKEMRVYTHIYAHIYISHTQGRMRVFSSLLFFCIYTAGYFLCGKKKRGRKECVCIHISMLAYILHIHCVGREAWEQRVAEKKRKNRMCVYTYIHAYAPGVEDDGGRVCV